MILIFVGILDNAWKNCSERNSSKYKLLAILVRGSLRLCMKLKWTLNKLTRFYSLEHIV